MKIKSIYQRLLKSTNYSNYRYLYYDFKLDNRLIGLIGSRGVGKTTLMLQYIKNNIKNSFEAIYVSVDNIYFSKTTLFDFVEELYENEDVKYFFFDEIHKYKNWNQELKNIYDSFPDIYIVFSGSSSMDLIKGSYDLSRRAIIYHLNGMSFREYLEFKYDEKLPILSFDEILEQQSEKIDKIYTIKKINKKFKQYLTEGYYPFLFENEEIYHQKLRNIVDKTIYEDISNFYNLKTENLYNFKILLSYLATIPPGELSINSISKNIKLDNKTISHYLTIMEEINLITKVRENRSGSTILKRKEKIYLGNTNLYISINDDIGFEYKIGTLRELFFINMLKNSNNIPYYSKIGDFEVNNYIFEIGGKSKSKKQIKGSVKEAFIVKDDIIYGSKRVIPLYLFGFIY